MQISQYFAISMPFFLLAVLAEKLYGYLKGQDTSPLMDAISSGYSGISMLVAQLLGITFVAFPYSMLVKYFSIFTIDNKWINYVIAFIAIDFSYYWGHRFSHQINYFWNAHLIHHSSEEFNLACALRQSISNFIHVFTIFLIPASIIGVPIQIIAFVTPLHQIMQYWYHTQHIGKLGWLEHVIVTPSHHRVHHAMNPIYIDKNHSAIFIVWDKLFGTFQKELDHEPPVYGITRPSQSYNPITINFNHIILLIKDAWRTESWFDKLSIWLKPTGWRPKGFNEQFPVKTINDVHHFKKFRPTITTGLFWWSMIQFFVVFFISIYLFSKQPYLKRESFYLFAAFIFVQIYSATELMNRNKRAVIYTFISTLVSACIYFYDNSFFGINNFSQILPVTLLSYFIIQLVAVFIFRTKEEDKFIASV